MSHIVLSNIITIAAINVHLFYYYLFILTTASTSDTSRYTGIPPVNSSLKEFLTSQTPARPRPWPPSPPPPPVFGISPPPLHHPSPRPLFLMAVCKPSFSRPPPPQVRAGGQPMSRAISHLSLPLVYFHCVIRTWYLFAIYSYGAFDSRISDRTLSLLDAFFG
jgi:hypothetical protein